MCCKVKKLQSQMKIMFSTGPDNLVETVSRNFPVEDGFWKGSILSGRYAA